MDKLGTIARGKPAGYDQEIVKRRSRLTAQRVALEGKLVLDFGCGNGAQTVQFAPSRCRLTAVDVEPRNLAVLQTYLRQHDLHHIYPLLYDGERLPFPDRCFDAVLSFEVLEHVSSETGTLQELHRVLKPGGDLVLSVPNKGWLFETHGAHLPLLPWHRVPFFSWLPPAVHRRYARARIYRKRDIINILEANGFDVVSAAYVTAPMDVVHNDTLQHLLRTYLFKKDVTPCTFMSTSILVHSRKAEH
ncbi:MAG: class I SAM-dependent methyltransferase [Fidelibacterota bacterium]|nr:MAG: class I SAM-dependent methyltransferase [Candidatus Neomarinimicrobiota bacterium]